MDRIAAFKSFIEQRPHDPFPVYSLAMEYRKQDRHEDARGCFDRLLAAFPDYVPAYFHAGANLVALGRRGDAARRYRLGIAASARVGDEHARSELEAALAGLGSEDGGASDDDGGLT
jgi:tetratricopeptide (TPR) repeat protein